MVMKRAEKHAGFLKDISDWKERERNGSLRLLSIRKKRTEKEIKSRFVRV